ncbi:hypothetical protein Xcel_1443 [Xylanimonas cellulosilytica DSM 15894]|uniref:Uncharacterized protein n=1 Tax=Xylanimonas cellulosilytica (strain DSM 15894 / JCM 12276 / CECT 5975 / KCTC 9989 / LMG 20990 / NBRC 107835 / XIL07) TaxID=446471 RepID=D1BRY2_XYLCX|nr:hypothetical protein [Xylanimonas cellulosilytica]ACZ30474.1 hypothetical protein Xcel_1443 [Xylanimonas cellulosilytica DSM 15894]
MSADPRHPGDDDRRAAARDGLRALVAGALPEVVRAQEAGDTEAGLDLVEFTHLLAEEAATMRDDAVAAARHQRTSWARIGARLGMSRQAAQQRFGVVTGDEGPTADPTLADLGDVWRLSPVTAFDEMEQLERYGQQGWHSIGCGPLYHDMAKDAVVWEHRRSSVLGPRRSRLEADGWTMIGTGWFPWAYYARRTDRPAQPTA